MVKTNYVCQKLRMVERLTNPTKYAKPTMGYSLTEQTLTSGFYFMQIYFMQSIFDTTNL